jgi:hypothetical protein
VILTSHVLDSVVFTDFTLRSVFTANSRLTTVVSVKLAARPLLGAVVYETTKQALNLNVHQDGGSASIGVPKILET